MAMIFAIPLALQQPSLAPRRSLRLQRMKLHMLLSAIESIYSSGLRQQACAGCSALRADSAVEYVIIADPFMFECI